MKDFLGNELNVGDKVVYIESLSDRMPGFKIGVVYSIEAFRAPYEKSGQVVLENELSLQESRRTSYTHDGVCLGLIKI